MSKESSLPPDQAMRELALDAGRSVLVQAPAGSGKTSLLTKRFLRLLREVDDPAEIVAITFTKAAAAEMRHRILAALAEAAEGKAGGNDPEMKALASLALERSRQLGWKLLELSSQLRILTIDSFCRGIAGQRPVLTGLGGALEIRENPEELYLLAARNTLMSLGERETEGNREFRAAVEDLLDWRDNNWQDVENQLVTMLKTRDRWMQDFVLARDWTDVELRSYLEQSFARAIRRGGGEAEDAPARYTDDEWRIVRSCFHLLKRAISELKVVFAETGAADFTEIAQLAQEVLAEDKNEPTETGLRIADGIRHLLVDEFQDTSRKQHKLIASIVTAWSEASGRSVFVVGDPMQSIYFFRDADAELFPRVRERGLELGDGTAHRFDFAPLASNFRTAHSLVEELNGVFEKVFAVNDGSAVRFSKAAPARNPAGEPSRRLHLHLEFVPKGGKGQQEDAAARKKAAQEEQVRQIVELVKSYHGRMEQAKAKNESFRIAVLGRARKALAPIASALRAEGIPFLAVDLEGLADRPEVRDAVALGRALLNGEDRVAWLGVLRAPWCGLSLADLHALAGSEEDEAKWKPVPELLKSRAELLSGQGQKSVERLRAAIAEAQSLRRESANTTLGTWLEQAWLRLGGANCVDAAARANLDLLWSSLDGLPDGEADVLGPALDDALRKLKALPDPEAQPERCVHLMTIHKSKGLEFEVVIVPEMQAATRRTHHGMIAWLERGLREEEAGGEVTEFLVAPQQSKGANPGTAKKWVAGVYNRRELQEQRRNLYVAATRAREELHLFARPEYKGDGAGRELVEPDESLLKTAWPAIEDEVRERFAAWKRLPAASVAEAGDSAANAGSEKPAILRRLPADYKPPALPFSSRRAEVVGLGGQLYSRHEGGLLSRALGTAVHALLEEMARLRVAHGWDAVKGLLGNSLPRVVAEIRAAGVEKREAERLGAEALAIALQAADDAVARWILSPHVEAASETRWAGVLDGKLRTVRADRVFRAGAAPMADGEDAWWIVDYKTAHADVPLEELRKVFAPQLETYARVLRLLHGDGVRVCAGLYYPRMGKLDWW